MVDVLHDLMLISKIILFEELFVFDMKSNASTIVSPFLEVLIGNNCNVVSASHLFFSSNFYFFILFLLRFNSFFFYSLESCGYLPIEKAVNFVPESILDEERQEVCIGVVFVVNHNIGWEMLYKLVEHFLYIETIILKSSSHSIDSI